MEQSLRRALDNGDARDPVFRESIYAASERALERLLQSKPMSEEEVVAQRIRLAETINRVEADYYVPADDEADDGYDETDDIGPEHGGTDGVGPDDGRELTEWVEDEGIEALHAPAEAWSGPQAVEALVSDQQTFAASRPPEEADPAPISALRPIGTPETAVWDPNWNSNWNEPAPGEDLWSPTGKKRPSRRKALAIKAAIAFGILLVVALLIYGLGYFTRVAGPVSSTSGLDTQTRTGSLSDGWITVFDGTQLGLISTPAGGRAEAILGAGGRPAVRLTFASARSEAAVAVGPGIVRHTLGKKVRIEISAGAPDSTARDFGVRCRFAGELICGRQSFHAEKRNESFEFDLNVPANGEVAGNILLDPGIEGTRSIDLYGVRLRVLETS